MFPPTSNLFRAGGTYVSLLFGTFTFWTNWYYFMDTLTR